VTEFNCAGNSIVQPPVNYSSIPFATLVRYWTQVHAATTNGLADVSQCALMRVPPEFMDSKQPLLMQVGVGDAVSSPVIIVITIIMIIIIITNIIIIIIITNIIIIIITNIITRSQHSSQVHTIILRNNLLTFLPKSMLCLTCLYVFSSFRSYNL
jgi:hypothetical protein